MNNKRIYEDKVKPLSSLFIDYYGNEHQDHINSRFNNLVYKTFPALSNILVTRRNNK